MSLVNDNPGYLLPNFATNDHFVGRTDLINIVRDLIFDELKGSKLGAIRVIQFEGARGLGKTWLSLQLIHLANGIWSEELSQSGYRLRAFWIGLGRYSNNENTEENEDKKSHRQLTVNEWLPSRVNADVDVHVDDQIIALLRKIARYTGATTVDAESDLATLTYWLKRDIDKDDKLRVLLVVDSVFEGDERFRDAIETHLLGPLADLQNTAFVFTGRGDEYVWKSSVLRRSSRYMLQPLSPDEVRQQVAFLVGGQNLAAVMVQLEDVMFDHAGHVRLSPGAIRKLVQGLPEVASPDSTTFKRAILKSLEATKSDFLSNLLGVNQRREELSQVKTALKVTSVLEKFKPAFISPMLDALESNIRIGDIEFERELAKRVRDTEMRDVLQKYRLARWDSDKRMYIVDETLSWLMSSILRLRFELQDGDAWNSWLRLNECAAAMFNHYADAYPNVADVWRNRAKPYQDEIERIKADTRSMPALP